MEALFLNAIRNTTALYQDKINKLINHYNAWYNRAGSNLEKNFVGDIGKTLPLAAEISNKEYSLNDDKIFYNNINLFLQTLKIAFDTSQKMSQTYSLETDISRAKRFIKVLQDTETEILETLDRYKTEEAANLSFDEKDIYRQIKAWWLRDPSGDLNQRIRDNSESGFNYEIEVYGSSNISIAIKIKESILVSVIDEKSHSVSVVSATSISKSGYDIMGDRYLLTFTYNQFPYQPILINDLQEKSKISLANLLARPTRKELTLENSQLIIFPFTVEEEEKILPILLKPVPPNTSQYWWFRDLNEEIINSIKEHPNQSPSQNFSTGSGAAVRLLINVTTKDTIVLIDKDLGGVFALLKLKTNFLDQSVSNSIVNIEFNVERILESPVILSSFFDPNELIQFKTQFIKDKEEFSGNDPRKYFMQLSEGKMNDVLPNLFQRNSKQSDIPNRNYTLKNRVHSDGKLPGDKDVLEYNTYAENIFINLTERSSSVDIESTTPPLNLGILAPWGRGKTELMKMIQDKFIAARNAEYNKTTGIKSESETLTKSQNKFINIIGKIAMIPIDQITKLYKWINNELISENPVPHATVWFNPWNYQSTQMIWAGLADAVINQIVEELPSKVQQEEFRFSLRVKRIDQEKLRRQLQLFVLNSFVWMIALIIGIIIFIATLICKLGDGGYFLTGILAAISASSFFLKYISSFSSTITENFEKLTEPLSYEKELGAFHEVNDDIKKVMEVLIDKKYPAVIFVDDLDRCSPSKVVEVIEAINIFMNGDFKDKCYFVIGMDAEMVAAALDVEYDKMREKLSRHEVRHGSLGWYFLDKFIQLPFFVPVMSEGKRKKYLEILLSDDNSQIEKASKPKEDLEVRQIINEVANELNADKRKEIIDSLPIEKERELDEEILKEQVHDSSKSKEVNEEVNSYARYLSPDPRSIKRFMNLLRFYSSHQKLRNIKGETCASIKSLAKWIALMLRFPQMVRWIQTEHDEKLTQTKSSEEKAKMIDELFDSISSKEEFARKFNLDEQTQKNEYPFESKDGKRYIMYIDEMPWLKSEVFYEIMQKDKTNESKLINALRSNVW